MKDTIEICSNEIVEYIANFWMVEPLDVYWGELYKMDYYDNHDVNDGRQILDALNDKYGHAIKFTFCFRKDFYSDLWQIIAQRI